MFLRLLIVLAVLLIGSVAEAGGSRAVRVVRDVDCGSRVVRDVGCGGRDVRFVRGGRDVVVVRRRGILGRLFGF